jgi:hypothetical protein
VSALLHAGVVNLGGFVLIRFAPWLEASPAARGLLVVAGLGSALLAAFAMLTRISIKVRLAWSTVAQMGFMVLECGLGLYPMAALHLIGHSLYKAHHFLAASSVVSDTRERMLATPGPVARASLLAAPWVSTAVVVALLQGLHGLVGGAASWPLWWTAILALAWAPLLWLPAGGRGTVWVGGLTGLGAVCGLAALAGWGTSCRWAWRPNRTGAGRLALAAWRRCTWAAGPAVAARGGRRPAAGPTPATTWTTWSPAWPAGCGPARWAAGPGAAMGCPAPRVLRPGPLRDLCVNRLRGVIRDGSFPARAPRSRGFGLGERLEADPRVEAACAQACRSFAPAWPLDQAIAVNPHWQRIGRLRQVAPGWRCWPACRSPPRAAGPGLAEGRIQPAGPARRAGPGRPAGGREAECLQALQTRRTSRRCRC